MFFALGALYREAAEPPPIAYPCPQGRRILPRRHEISSYLEGRAP